MHPFFYLTSVNVKQWKQIIETCLFSLSTDNQLFYTGPSRQYMRLVVLSEEQKQAVLQECHHNPGKGNHNGVRRTRDRVIAGYYWSTIKADVTDWVKSIFHRIDGFHSARALCETNDVKFTCSPQIVL